ncbi:MAG: ATP-dependent DNA helicase RecG, partial [Flavobacteriales bacterium]|nr:ATP-dependent DNA helicase RecG [Flavobacteriales bacterium]
MSVLDTKIEFLKGVGPKRSLLLNQELSIFSFLDLLTFFPFRYIDRTSVLKINQINNFDIDIQVVGLVKSIHTIGVGKKKRLVVKFFDETGEIDLIFFKGISWLLKSIIKDNKYLIFGKP